MLLKYRSSALHPSSIYPATTVSPTKHLPRPETQVRQSRYDFDEAVLKPYLSLEAVTGAVFDVAGGCEEVRYV